MSYVIQAVLSNAQHPEYGQVTIPFPIPNQNYDCTIELLEPLEIGDTLRQDCQVDELDSFYTVLNALIGTQVTLDELDYLAKRLDSFDDGEAAQFQGMAHKLGLSKIKDLINLTFCCQKATVITDFSDLEKIGREHYMNLNGGCARTEDLEALDGTETAYLLIDSGAGTVTPYGVAYDNSMKLEPLYNGRQFPEYLYDNSSMGLKIVPAENQAPELLWLPASEQQIRRTLLRAGWQDPDHADYTIDVFLLQKEAGRILNEKRDSLHSLNAMCGAIAKLEQKDRDKLEAVIVFAEPENAGAIRRLAENLEQFDFIPGIHTPEEYGRYMIRESGRFEYDDILEAFYDYEGYGQHRIQQENGRFSGYGYVSYPGTMALEDLMAEDPAEAYEIIQAVMLENGRGFALGHNPAAPSPYVTWACYDDKDGQRQYEWGHYGSDRAALEQDFAARMQEYQRLYNVDVRQVEAPGLYKYYSTQRPVDIGTFPKPPRNAPDEIVNYDQRVPVENGSFLAWGHLTYTRPLTKRQASDYELRPAPDNPDRPRSIREQMKTAAKQAEADRGQAAPKKNAPDRGDR